MDHQSFEHPKTSCLHIRPYNVLVDLLEMRGMHGVTADMEQFGGILVAFTRMSETICLKCSPISDVSFLRMLAKFRNLRRLHLADSFISGLCSV
jgi:hypothetical protein